MRYEVTNRSSVVRLDRTVLPCGGRLDFQSRLDGVEKVTGDTSENLLSQVTVRRIKQLALEMYAVTSSLTNSISESLLP